MLKNLFNTHIKKLWWIWFLSLFSIIIIVLLSTIFTIKFKYISNVFFGFAISFLMIIVFFWLYYKKNSYDEAKGKDGNIPIEIIEQYYPKNTKITSHMFRDVQKKRTLYVSLLSIILTAISFIIAIIFSNLA